MEAWIPITIAAAFLQNIRSALQKHLRGELSISGATFVRFSYGFPLALLYLAGLAAFGDIPLPRPNATFALFVATGGLAQIAATALLVSLFTQRSFAVGTTYSKTETVQTALFGLIVLGEGLSLGAFLGIVISLAGVLALSVARTETTLAGLLLSWTQRPALVGLASGGAFGIAAVSYRAASLSLGSDSVAMSAAYTLASVTVLQTVVIALYMAAREPGEIGRTLRVWRWAFWVGASGIAASACWFTAMTLQNAAYVRALGQVELVFTVLASIVIFRERTNLVELAGISLTVAGILVLLLSP